MSERIIVSPRTIGEAMHYGAKHLSGNDTALLDARILLRRVLGVDDGQLIAQANDPMGRDHIARYDALLARRKAGEPVAYLTGEKEFWSLPFKVTPDVLIPRDDSGALVEAALARRGRDEGGRILDLGTGSGCLLCALLHEFPTSQGVGIDRSEAALAVAQENAISLGVANRASFLSGDWFAPATGVFDIVIANPPYIRSGDRDTLARDVADYEPPEALFGGQDGLEAYREIIDDLPQHLTEDALILMECGDEQTASLAALLTPCMPENTLFTLYDLAGRPRGVGSDLRNRQKRD